MSVVHMPYNNLASLPDSVFDEMPNLMCEPPPLINVSRSSVSAFPAIQYNVSSSSVATFLPCRYVRL